LPYVAFIVDGDAQRIVRWQLAEHLRADRSWTPSRWTCANVISPTAA
jgi:hypothetical protein